jgi:hypothetical protein
MLKILKTIVTKLGCDDTSERNHVDTFTENRIRRVSGEQIASSENGGIWGVFQELSGYTFLNISIINPIEIKTLKGCELTIIGTENELRLKSDTREIESDFSNVSNRWLTNICFDVSSINTEIIQKDKVEHITIKWENKSLNFESVK